MFEKEKVVPSYPYVAKCLLCLSNTAASDLPETLPVPVTAALNDLKMNFVLLNQQGSFTDLMM